MAITEVGNAGRFGVSRHELAVDSGSRPCPLADAGTFRSVSIQEDSPTSLRRAGARWTDSEYVALIEFLRNGVVLEDIAAAHERSTKAISAQLRMLVPAGADLKASERELWLREQLAGGYGWQAVLIQNYHADGRHYFTDDDDSALREFWDGRVPLAEMAARLRAPEVHVAKHLVELGLASSMVEVTKHIEVAEASTVGVRARLAADRAACAVWVLTVYGASETPAARPLPLNRHTSLHATRDDALAELDRLIANHERGNTRWPPLYGEGAVKWSITERTVGEGTAGAEDHGVYQDGAEV